MGVAVQQHLEGGMFLTPDLLGGKQVEFTSLHPYAHSTPKIQSLHAPLSMWLKECRLDPNLVLTRTLAHALGINNSELAWAEIYVCIQGLAVPVSSFTTFGRNVFKVLHT